MCQQRNLFERGANSVEGMQGRPLCFLSAAVRAHSWQSMIYSATNANIRSENFADNMVIFHKIQTHKFFRIVFYPPDTAEINVALEDESIHLPFLFGFYCSKRVVVVEEKGGERGRIILIMRWLWSDLLIDSSVADLLNLSKLDHLKSRMFLCYSKHLFRMSYIYDAWKNRLLQRYMNVA